MSGPQAWQLGAPGAPLHPSPPPAAVVAPTAAESVPAESPPPVWPTLHEVAPIAVPDRALCPPAVAPTPVAAKALAPRRPGWGWQRGLWLVVGLAALGAGGLGWRALGAADTPAPPVPSPLGVPALDAAALAQPAPLATPTPPAPAPAAPTPAPVVAADPWARPPGVRQHLDGPVVAPAKPMDADAWLAGNQLLAAGQWQAAIAAYQRAYAAAPDAALAHNLALALSAAGDEAAAQHWRLRAGDTP